MDDRSGRFNSRVIGRKGRGGEKQQGDGEDGFHDEWDSKWFRSVRDFEAGQKIITFKFGQSFCRNCFPFAVTWVPVYVRN